MEIELFELYKLSFIAVIIIMILNSIFIAGLYKFLIKPIKSLNKSSNKIAQGNYSVRIKLKQDDEIGDLAKSFNKMADAIETKVTHIEELATTDELTKLYNRRFVFKRLNDELDMLRRGQTSTSSISVLMIDIDFFKKVNDTYGHHIGDLVIQEVSKTIVRNCRNSDVIGRYGGEELILFSFGISLEKTTILAEKIRKSIESISIPVDNTRNATVTISIGVNLIEKSKLINLQDIDEIIINADKALYKAKENGRNRVEVYSE